MSVLILCISTNCLESQAAPKDVTKTISGKDKIKNLVNLFTDEVGYVLQYKLEQGNSTKYNFAKASDRKKALRWNYTGKVNTYSKRMFEKNTKNTSSSGADWWMSWPSVKINKIYKLSAKKYRVECSVYIESEVAPSYRLAHVLLISRKNQDPIMDMLQR